MIMCISFFYTRSDSNSCVTISALGLTSDMFVIGLSCLSVPVTDYYYVAGLPNGHRTGTQSLRSGVTSP